MHQYIWSETYNCYNCLKPLEEILIVYYFFSLIFQTLIEMISNPSSCPWHLMSAVEVVEALKSGRVTPLELIDVVETRLKETDYLLHTTPITCY